MDEMREIISERIKKCIMDEGQNLQVVTFVALHDIITDIICIARGYGKHPDDDDFHALACDIVDEILGPKEE